MTKATELEAAIVKAARSGDQLPQQLPNWMINLGISPGDIVESGQIIGGKNPKNKTDILIKFRDSSPLKISVKLSNADYFGNWYTHERIIAEFGKEVFYKLTEKVTEWANRWAYNPRAKIFVGVSISFGYRTGNTLIPFLDIFDEPSDLIKIIAGVGDGENAANCLYFSSKLPNNFEEIITQLRPINQQYIENLVKPIAVICRPVNPQTEYTNRGKNTFTKFQPYQAFKNAIIVDNIASLMQTGEFITLEKADNLNHNRLLNELENKYKIIIPRKQK